MVPGKEWACQEVSISPPPGVMAGDGKWLSVDGEEYEVLPMNIKLKPQFLTLYSPHFSSSL